MVEMAAVPHGFYPVVLFADRSAEHENYRKNQHCHDCDGTFLFMKIGQKDAPVENEVKGTGDDEEEAEPFMQAVDRMVSDMQKHEHSGNGNNKE